VENENVAVTLEPEQLHFLAGPILACWGPHLLLL
jgi:hypothetical protein